MSLKSWEELGRAGKSWEELGRLRQILQLAKGRSYICGSNGRKNKKNKNKKKYSNCSVCTAESVEKTWQNRIIVQNTHKK